LLLDEIFYTLAIDIPSSEEGSKKNKYKEFFHGSPNNKNENPFTLYMEKSKNRNESLRGNTV